MECDGGCELDSVGVGDRREWDDFLCGEFGASALDSVLEEDGSFCLSGPEDGVLEADVCGME